jgi:(R)-citramalyl-CoA lyase
MRVQVVDVGPRDGLQNEDKSLAPEIRAELCDRLAAAGVPRVEAASFVNPKRVPQMAGAEKVMAAIDRRPGTSYAGLVLNEKGYERAVEAGVDEVRYAFPVTETFARRNQNTTVAEATQLAGRLVERARLDGVRVSITLSAAFGDPFEGRVEPGHVRTRTRSCWLTPSASGCRARCGSWSRACSRSGPPSAATSTTPATQE